MEASTTVAIVPMKSLVQAKTRLSEELTLPQRMALSRNLLRRVLRATVGPASGVAGDSPVESVWVVGGDAAIRDIARDEGALWYEEEGADINDTLWLAFQRAFSSCRAALFLPGDLPFLKPHDVYSLVSASGRLKNVTLAPARQGGGTNGILVPPDLAQPFRPLLGPDSFRRHLSQATELGLSVAICYSPGLAFDLDTFDDARAYEYMEPGFMEMLTEDGTGNSKIGG